MEIKPPVAPRAWAERAYRNAGRPALGFHLHPLLLLPGKCPRVPRVTPCLLDHTNPPPWARGAEPPGGAGALQYQHHPPAPAALIALSNCTLPGAPMAALCSRLLPDFSAALQVQGRLGTPQKPQEPRHTPEQWEITKAAPSCSFSVTSPLFALPPPDPGQLCGT